MHLIHDLVSYVCAEGVLHGTSVARARALELASRALKSVARGRITSVMPIRTGVSGRDLTIRYPMLKKEISLYPISLKSLTWIARARRGGENFRLDMSRHDMNQNRLSC